MKKQTTSKMNIKCNIHRPDTSGMFCLDCGAKLNSEKVSEELKE